MTLMCMIKKEVITIEIMVLKTLDAKILTVSNTGIIKGHLVPQ